MPDHRPFDQEAERAGHDEGHDHRDEEVSAHESGRVILAEMRAQIGHVGAEDHELAVRHIDHAHLPEDDRETECHQHEDREQDEPGKALHRQNRHQIAERIVAEHLALLSCAAGPERGEGRCLGLPGRSEAPARPY
jgi:hypothetical protein